MRIGILQILLFWTSLMAFAYENSQLSVAVLNRDLAQVTQLLDDGAAVDELDQNKKTALMIAAEKGFFDVAKLLMDRGANSKLKDKQGNTIFHFAAMGGSLELMNHLKALKRPFNEGNEAGETPYTAAIVADQVAAMNLLDTWGGSFKGKTKQSHTLLGFAAKHGAVAVIEHLCSKGAAVDQRSVNGHTPLMTAVLALQVDAVKTLLKLGANPIATEFTGQSPQTYASLARNREIYELLRNRGWKGEALFEAVYAGNVDAVLDQISKGMSIDTINPDGESPLFVAAANGQGELLQALLSKGANPMLASNYQWTPLYVAAFRGHLECVKRLLAHGAKPNVPVPGGDTPLGAALAKAYHEVAEELIAKGASALYFLPGTNQALQVSNTSLKELAAIRQNALNAREFGNPDVPFWIKERLEQEPIDLNLYQTSSDITLPVFKKSVPPVYPKGALVAKNQGGVVLQAVLRKDGTITDIEVLKSFQNWRHGFEVAAMKAIREWTFEPGRHQGKAVDVRMAIKMGFVVN